MYVVKHIPTGKYLRRTSGSPMWRFSLTEKNWPLTDDIRKARVYNQFSHVKSSIGTSKKIGQEERTWIGYKGVKHTGVVDIYGPNEINPEIWEVIEIGVTIKE